jgi:hypothetical protein
MEFSLVRARFRDPSDVEGTDPEKLDAFRVVRDEIKKWIFD